MHTRFWLQVIQQTVLDLLTAQCDRHSENVFITPAGDLTFIDNDRALGVVTRCGGDSMLLPGNRCAYPFGYAQRALLCCTILCGNQRPG